MQDPFGERDETQADPVHGRGMFSSKEIRDIVLSMAILTVGVFILSTGQISRISWATGFGVAGALAVLFAISLAIIVLSFPLYELAHKFVARRYGMRSEYRMDLLGPIFVLITPFMGFLFAVPGMVYVHGCADAGKNGRIGMAGPLVNIVLATIGLAVSIILPDSLTRTEYLVFVVASTMLLFNASMATFNLIPFGQLDGKKILSWNIGVWAFMIAIPIIELVYYFFYL